MTERGKRPLEVELPLRVGTYDIDYAGIVSNIVYLRWLEDLRTVILEAHFPLQEQLARGRTPVLLSTEIHYVRAIRLFEKPLGRMWLASAGKVRWALEGEISVDGKLAARAKHELASVDATTFKPLPADPKLRELFEAAQKA